MKYPQMYRAEKSIDIDKFIDLLSTNAIYNDPQVTKAYISKSIIYFSTGSSVLMEQLEKKFPNVFHLSTFPIPVPFEEIFSNHSN